MSTEPINPLKRGPDAGTSVDSEPKKLKLEDELDDIFSEPGFMATSEDKSVISNLTAINDANKVNEEFSDLPEKILQSNVLGGGAESSIAQQLQTVTQATPSTLNSTVQQQQPQPSQSITPSQSQDLAPVTTQSELQIPAQAPPNQGPNQPNKLQNDPARLNDALAAAGINIQQEEELLLQQQQNRKEDISKDLKQIIKASKPPPFLNNYHLAAFINKVATNNGIQQNFLQEADLLELVSAACESWMSNIIQKTIILSRHRRRGIPNLNVKANKKGSTANANSRSELSKELRNIAVGQKELEERRVQKRIMLGLEKSDPSNDGLGGDGKAGAEETLHRAANATAAMMSNTGRKKYSWMTSANGAGAEAAKGTDEKSKKSSIIAIRGENGLRFREIRSGNSVTMKDLLGAIEDERMGTDKAIVKAYAKLKD
ncbi:TAF4-domain-containing protein [Scheffersomyces coipomensis]|uniref:TAF4-domain-containing protein n=1 Tax=Scheffersomyces coipomensis TaxID=1788519 RepID=UPI00315DC92B